MREAREIWEVRKKRIHITICFSHNIRSNECLRSGLVGAHSCAKEVEGVRHEQCTRATEGCRKQLIIHFRVEFFFLLFLSLPVFFLPLHYLSTLFILPSFASCFLLPSKEKREGKGKERKEQATSLSRGLLVLVVPRDLYLSSNVKRSA